MHPKIYESDEQKFETNGLGALTDAVKIRVTEERNGGFYVEMDYPIDGKMAEEIKRDRVIVVAPNPIDKPQPFRIYDVKKSQESRMVSIKANHITFDDSSNFLINFTRSKTSANIVLEQMTANREQHTPVVYSTDITTPISVDWSKKSPTNAIAGEQGSFIQTVNSEIKRDGWEVTVNANRGRHPELVFRDGKDLTGFDLEEDVSEVVTKIYPFKTYKPEGSDEDKTITLPEKFVVSPLADKYPFERVAYLDLSQDETIKDEDGLRKATTKKFTQEHVDEPKISGTLKAVNLSKNPEYEFIGNLQSVLVCDYIQCVSNAINEKCEIQVSKVVYDPISEDYESIDIGMKKLSLAQSINNTVNNIKNDVQNMVNKIDVSIDSDGTTTYYSDTAPTEPPYDLKEGDIWFQKLADGRINSWMWDDGLSIWKPIYNNDDFDKAMQGAEDAKKQAQEASNKADVIENELESSLNDVRIDIDGVKHDAVNALQKAEDAVLNANAAQQGVDTLKDRVDIYSTNIGNLFPNGNFTNHTFQMFDNYGGRYSVNQQPPVVEGAFTELGVPYGVKNTSPNTFVVPAGQKGIVVKSDYSFNVNSGEEFYVQYDFHTDGDTPPEVGVLFDTGLKASVRPAEVKNGSWYRIKGKITAPDKATSGVGYVTFADARTGYARYANISISRVDASTALIELQDGKITEAVKQGEALNQRVQTAEGTIESIENMEGNNTLINTVKGQQQSIKDAQGNALEALETAKGTQTVVEKLGDGKNLLNGTDTFDSKYWTQRPGYPSTTLLDVSPAIDGAPTAAKMDKVTALTAGKIYGPITLEKGRWYTVSMFLKGDANTSGQIEFVFLHQDAGQHLVLKDPKGVQTIGTEWKRVSYSFEGTGKSYKNFYGRINGGTVNNNAAYYIAGYQLEKGGDLTAYSPSLSEFASRSELTQTADLIKGEISSLDEKTKASLALLQDSINLKVDKDGVINQINVSPEGVLIDGNKIHLTGDTTIDNAIIPSAAIKDLSADKITTGTLNAANVNITNLDVNKLTGDYSSFLKTAWKDSNSYSEITPDGLKFYKEGSGVFEKDSYLSVYSSQLTWRTSRKAWHYISQSLVNGNRRNTLTIAGVTNGDTYPASISLRSSGYDCATFANRNAHYGGKYVFVGSVYNYSTDGQKTARDELVNSKDQTEDLSTETYRLSLSATNDIAIGTSSKTAGAGVRFTPSQVTDSSWETQIVFNNDNSQGMFIKSVPTYNRTYSYSSNMFVTSNGYFGRATSAKKYKQDIEYIDNIEEAKRTLDIQPAEWADKAVLNERAKKRVSGEELTDSLRRRYIGFIADDFADEGFEKLVLRDDKGEVEEFQYDRLSVYHHQMIKDLYKRIEELDAKVAELSKKELK